MPNPFGIAEVDLPGIYGAVSNLRSARIQQMLGQQQIRASEAALDRQGRIQQILAGAYGRQMNSGTPAQGNETGAAPSTAPAAPPSPVAAAAPVPAAAAQPSYQLAPEVQAQLIAIDPEQGAQIVQAFRQMDVAQRERTTAASNYMANAAMHLTTIPDIAARRAEIQRIAPDLLAHGVTQEQIAGFDPTDNNLRYIVGQARDLEHLAAEARDTFTEVGGELLSTNALRQRRPDDRGVVFSSPYIPTPEGLAARPGPGAPAAGSYQDGETRVINGTTYRREGGVWHPQGPAATQTGAAPDWPIPGGAASGRQNFPQ